MKASRVFILTTLLLLFGAASAEGCTCGYPSPAESFHDATAVFVGRVIRAEPPTAGAALDTGQKAVVRVEEAFKGARVGGSVALTQPDDDCSPNFDAGKRYLFYAYYNRETKTWTVYGCGRASDLGRAADDLLYLRALPLSAERNRVSGTLLHYEDGPEKGFTFVERLAGAEVRVQGKDKTYEVTTDSNGVYEIYDLPPGRYTIEPELPPGLSIRFPRPFGPVVAGAGGYDKVVTVELTGKTCAGSDFIASSDNTIGGTVFGPGGALLPGVCLELQAAGEVGNFSGGGRIFGCADAEGRYKLEQVPPGRYFIVANGWGKIDGNTPFPLTFYPGTFEREKASVVTVGRGESRNDYDVTVPLLLPTVKVSGVLQYSDGRPAAREGVFFNVTSPDPRYGRSSTLTDEAGRFSLKVLNGVPGNLGADFFAYEGMFEKTCPAIKRLIEKEPNNRGSVIIKAEPVAFDAEADASDLRVVLPVPFCPLAKKEDDRQQ